MKKISFLIAAHNEEKIIGKTLDNLLHIPYENYEVIVGLDGCTDGTEEIVKSYCRKSKKFRYYSLNLRNGKPAVINHIVMKSKGEVIIINDADWIFRVKNKRSIEKMIGLFEESKVGGIAESFPVEWANLKKSNFIYKMVAYTHYYWFDFQKKKFSNKGFIKKPDMFLTNIFRRSLYKTNSSLGDDFERTHDIMNEGFKIAIFYNPEMPRMVASYNKITLSDFFKQKIRTAMARKQVNIETDKNINLFNYGIPSAFYIILKSFRKNLLVGLYSISWFFLTFLATIFSKFKKVETKEGWLLRAKR